MISIKDYAERRGKTVQAVYQQIKRRENAEKLTGHITTIRIGNKDVKHLDDVAVEILDESSVTTPSVVIQNDLSAELTAANDKLAAAEKQLAFAEGKLQALRELIADKDAELRRALSEPREKIVKLEVVNEVLSTDLEDARKEIENLRAENEAMRSAGFWARLKGWRK